MNLILCDDDKVFLNKLEIRIRGLSQKHKIAVKMECYVSAKEMLEGIKNLDEISVFFIDIDMPEVNGFEVASYLKSGTGNVVLCLYRIRMIWCFSHWCIIHSFLSARHIWTRNWSRSCWNCRKRQERKFPK